MNEQMTTQWQQILHNVPVQLHLLHLLHQPEGSSFEVCLETDVVFQDKGFIHLLVNHLKKKKIQLP